MSPAGQGRRPFIAGNWKMHHTPAEAVDFIGRLKALLPPDPGLDVAVAPAFVALEAAVRAAAGSPITIAAQNVYWEEEGAFTGEVSVRMLRDIGVELVLVGHSERRQYFGETDGTVNRRVKAVLSGGLAPLVCVGEDLDQREAGQTFDLLSTQVAAGLAGLDPGDLGRLTLAYEPVWAIGTGRTATPEVAQEAHAFLRGELGRRFDPEVANSVRILYGGSVKVDNVAALMAQPDIDGALVGGASLDPEVFFKIINYKGQ